MSTPALLAYGPATYCAGDTSGGSPPAAVGSAVGCEEGFDESSTFIVGGMIRCVMKAVAMGHHWKKYLGITVKDPIMNQTMGYR